jgi:hypothetical protein
MNKNETTARGREAPADHKSAARGAAAPASTAARALQAYSHFIAEGRAHSAGDSFLRSKPKPAGKESKQRVVQLKSLLL